MIRAKQRISRAVRLAAIEPVNMPADGSAKLIAILPDGETLPLLWIRNYSSKATQQYKLAEPVRLPAGTQMQIEGVGSFRLRLAM